MRCLGQTTRELAAAIGKGSVFRASDLVISNGALVDCTRRSSARGIGALLGLDGQ